LKLVGLRLDLFSLPEPIRWKSKSLMAGGPRSSGGAGLLSRCGRATILPRRSRWSASTVHHDPVVRSSGIAGVKPRSEARCLFPSTGLEDQDLDAPLLGRITSHRTRFRPRLPSTRVLCYPRPEVSKRSG
jgi:hypothetical protein